MDAFDLVVIGAGPGGYVAALRAAQLGLRTALVERRHWGGVCLNRGCIPSKCLLEDSLLYSEVAANGLARGIACAKLSPDWQAMQARKDKVVAQLAKGVEYLLKKSGVKMFFGEARFLGPGAVAVTVPGGETAIGGKAFLVATGSESAELPRLSPDGKHVLTSTEALSLPQLPRSLAVIGAGAIGLELGSVFARLGVEVSVIEMMPQCLPGMDSELAAGLLRELKKARIPVYLESRVTTCEPGEEAVKLAVEGGFGGTVEAEQVLLAVGRRPCTEGLELERAGVKTDARGFIEVGADYRTSAPTVFAIGDVIGGQLLAHKASHEGIAAAEIIAGQPCPPRRAIPSVVYTHPEVASVGLTSEEAAGAGRRVAAGKFFFRANGRALALNAPAGFAKVIADAETDELLGVHILGPSAGELIHEAAVALAAGMKAEDYARVVRAHPTLSEAIGEAALACAGRAIHWSD